MRLWSIHPKYLDAQGLVALWREGLLAKKVLEGKTKGYRHHPQLDRFKACRGPLSAINNYLHVVCDEAQVRGYRFDRSKLNTKKFKPMIEVTRGQINYEWKHLLNKLKARSPHLYMEFKNKKRVDCHPLFLKVAGKIESWEIV